MLLLMMKIVDLIPKQLSVFNFLQNMDSILCKLKEYIRPISGLISSPTESVPGCLTPSSGFL